MNEKNKYPCDCDEMRFMIDNHELFMYDNHNEWFLTWIVKEFDEEKGVTNLPKLGVKFDYCMFCGKEIQG
jgi:hypothetical protein